MDREDCPVQKLGYEYFEKVVNMIGGKWKMRVLYILGLNKIKKCTGKCSAQQIDQTVKRTGRRCTYHPNRKFKNSY